MFYITKLLFYCSMKINNKNSATSGRATKKTELIKLLDNYDINGALAWLVKQRRSISLVSSLLFTQNQILRWRAIDVLGKLSRIINKNNNDSIRKLFNHNFWMLNDESGNVGWYAPETIGEVLYNVPEFIDEFGIMLPSFIIEEPFERGTHWAIARVAEIKPEIFFKDFSTILKSLEDSDPYIRVFTIKATMLIDPLNAKPKIEKLAEDQEKVELYNFTTGNMYQTTVAEYAKDYLGN